MRKRFIPLAAVMLTSLAPAFAAPSTNLYFGNIAATGSGSCAAITGVFPVQITYSTNSAGANTYYFNIIIQVKNNDNPSGLSQQYLTDVLSPNRTYTAFDPNLFGTFNAIPGTYTGPISVNNGGLAVGDANGPVTLTSGSCVIKLAAVTTSSPS